MRSKILKKVVASIWIGALSISMLACGGGDANTGATNTGTAGNTAAGNTTATEDFHGKTLTIGLWFGSTTEQAAINELKSQFEQQTGCTVNFKTYTDYTTQILADFAGRTAPDVFYVDSSVFPQFDADQVFVTLDKTEFDVASFYPNIIAAFTDSSGNVKAIPKDQSTLALYYNEDMLTKCGYTASDIPGSYEDLKTFLPEFQSKLDAEYGAGRVTAMTYNVDLARNLHILERDGGSIIDANGKSTLEDATVVKNQQFLVDMWSKGMKAPKDLGSNDNGEAFGTGRTAMMEEGNWVYENLKANYSNVNFAVKPMMSYEGKTTSMSFTVGWGIYAFSQEQDLAKAWVKFATSKESQVTYCKGAGTLPGRPDASTTLGFASDPVMGVHMDMIPDAVPWQKGVNLTIINTQYQNFLPNAINGSTSVQNAMQQADAQANSQIGN